MCLLVVGMMMSKLFYYLKIVTLTQTIQITTTNYASNPTFLTSRLLMRNKVKHLSYTQILVNYNIAE